jgi:hypothetical protein
LWLPVSIGVEVGMPGSIGAPRNAIAGSTSN